MPEASPLAGAMRRVLLGDRIGQGSYAVVYKGRVEGHDETVAVKIIRRQKLANKRVLVNFEAETSILKQINHPHIVRLFDIIQTRDNFNLVMEFCALGDLSFFMRKRWSLGKNVPFVRSLFDQFPCPTNGGLHEVLVRHFLVQLASALEYLHAHNLIHRDIKPQNLLLKPPDSWTRSCGETNGSVLTELPILKVADFGFARFLATRSMAETLCGSPLYMAPEILRFEKYNGKADLWSVGAVTYELATGSPPFRAANYMELNRIIEKANDCINFPVGVNLSNDLKDLLRKLLRRVPDERIDFKDFFNHPAIHDKSEASVIDSDNFDANMYISEYLAHAASLESSMSDSHSRTQIPFQDVQNMDGNRADMETNLLTAFPHNQEDRGRAASKLDPSNRSNTYDPSRDSHSEYIIVDKSVVEAEAMEDGSETQARSGDRSASRDSRKRPSSIVYGMSPTTALAQALLRSSARLFGTRWDSRHVSTTPPSVHSNLLKVGSFPLSRRTSLQSESTLISEQHAMDEAERFATLGKAVLLCADTRYEEFNLKLSSDWDSKTKETVVQEALVLYFKALSFLHEATNFASKCWTPNKVISASPSLLSLVQWVQDKYNDAVEKAKVLRQFLQGDLRQGIPVVAERLLFDRAVSVTQRAAAQELSADYSSAELNYCFAAWLFSAISEPSMSGRNWKSEELEIVDRMMRKVRSRLAILRRRRSPSQSTSS